MFAYCNNNPVNRKDSSGTSPDDFAGWIGSEIGKWLYQIIATDPDERDISGELTLNAKIKNTGMSVLKNLEASFGVGMGFFGETTVLDLIGVGIGFYVTNQSILYQDGAWNFGQESYAGVSATLLFLEMGAAESGFRPNGEEWQQESWTILNNTQEAITILSASAYAGIGGSFSIGFDLNSFLRNLDIIWGI
jgi:hypothetical protein